MSYVIEVDEGACAAHGDCAVVAPNVFRIEDVAVVVGEAPDEVLLRAAQACPSVAILVFDEETGAQVYP
jgi:ferredoxin